jgi:hypothetical protein
MKPTYSKLETIGAQFAAQELAEQWRAMQPQRNDREPTDSQRRNLRRDDREAGD